MLDATTLSLGGLNKAEDKTAAAKKSLGDTYDQFLTLLTTQLKNQDPLNPTDSKDFTNQLIAMSNTEQQIAQTQKMDELIQLNQASTVNMALNYIGLNVDYQGNTLSFDGASPMDINYNLETAGVKGKVSILNDQNQVVWSSNAALTAGPHKVTWDGKDNLGQPVAAGNYRVEVGVLNSTNGAVKSDITVPGLVTGVETTSDGQVMLSIGDQKVPINTVQSAYMRRYVPPAQNG